LPYSGIAVHPHALGPCPFILEQPSGACQARDQVAAVGVVAAAVVDLQNCIATHPVPLLAFHGTADPLMPYQGGDMRGRLLREAASLFRAAPTFSALKSGPPDGQRTTGACLSQRAYRRKAMRGECSTPTVTRALA
jgi:poly(3-hydroxybutyrate) depolymerase